MRCPNCDTELVKDHVHTHKVDNVEITHIYYTCLNPQCINYLKIVNSQDEDSRIKANQSKGD